jgi:hypothetical protein
MGIEPTSPENKPGRSIAVELRENPRSSECLLTDAVCLQKRLETFRRIRWASGVIERRHSLPGIEPGPPRLAPRTVRPPWFWWITDQLRPIESEMVRKPGFAPGPSRSQREVLLLHHDPDSNWSPWSDSHRRIRVYETRPVAAEAQGLKWCPRQELHL